MMMLQKIHNIAIRRKLHVSLLDVRIRCDPMLLVTNTSQQLTFVLKLQLSNATGYKHRRQLEVRPSDWGTISYIITESTFHDRYYIWSDLLYLKQHKNKSAIKLKLFDIKKYLSNYITFLKKKQNLICTTNVKFYLN